MIKACRLLLSFALVLQAIPALCAPKAVASSKGPIRLSLIVYSTKIKVNDPLWFKIRLTNISKKPIEIREGLFDEDKDFQAELERNQAGTGIFLFIIDPKGEPLRWRDRSYLHGCVKGRKHISDDGKFYAKEYRVGEPVDPALLPKVRKPTIERVLRPGQSITTRAWRAHGPCDETFDPPPAGASDYAELRNLEFDAPGKYRIKAVYDNEPGEDARREFKEFGEEPFGPEWIRLETSELSVLVRP